MFQHLTNYYTVLTYAVSIKFENINGPTKLFITIFGKSGDSGERESLLNEDHDFLDVLIDCVDLDNIYEIGLRHENYGYGKLFLKKTILYKISLLVLSIKTYKIMLKTSLNQYKMTLKKSLSFVIYSL